MPKERAQKKEEIEDVVLWNVDRTLRRYGGDRQLKGQAEGLYTGITKFLNDNGMFKKKRRAVDARGKLLIREISVGDLTDEGFEFLKKVMKPWFNSKAAAKDPTKTAILEKHLKQVRG